MNKIAVVFPGIGYNNDKPLLYYASKLASELGYENIIKVTYISKINTNIRGNEKAMRETFDELYSDASMQLNDIDFTQYDDILFISKSIGTAVATAYADSHDISNVKHILYTPLVYTFDYEIQNAVAFIGTNDAWSDYKEVVRLANEKDIDISIYEGRNHSLETETTIENIACLQDIMRKTKKYIT